MKKREALTFATTKMDLRTRSSVRETDTEGHTGCDSIDGKRPEEADPQTEIRDHGCQGLGQ